MKFIKSVFTGEVFLVLFVLSGFYKAAFENLPDLTIIFFVLSFISAVSRLYKSPSLHKDMILPTFYYVIICAIMIAGLTWSGNNQYAFDKTYNFLLVTGWSFIGVFLLTDKKKPFDSLKRYFFTFLSVGFVMIINSFFSDETARYLTAFGSNYLALGKMASIAALLLISYVYINKTRKHITLFLLMLFGISLYALLLTGGRMPVVSLVICLLFLFTSGIRVKGFNLLNIRIKKKTLVFSFAGILTVPILINVLYEQGNLFLQRFLLLFDGGGDSALSRTNHIGDSLSAFLETNMLGLGVGGYINYVGSTSERAYPHNIFLEIMAELGVIGLIVFLFLLITSIKRFFKYFYYKNNFFSVALILLFLYAFLNALTSGDINDNRMLFFFIALLCLSKLFGSSLKLEK